MISFVQMLCDEPKTSPPPPPPTKPPSLPKNWPNVVTHVTCFPGVTLYAVRCQRAFLTGQQSNPSLSFVIRGSRVFFFSSSLPHRSSCDPCSRLDVENPHIVTFPPHFLLLCQDLTKQTPPHFFCAKLPPPSCLTTYCHFPTTLLVLPTDWNVETTCPPPPTPRNPHQLDSKVK